jgi:hypothetical protein
MKREMTIKIINVEDEKRKEDKNSNEDDEKERCNQINNGEDEKRNND